MYSVWYGVARVCCSAAEQINTASWVCRRKLEQLPLPKFPSVGDTVDRLRVVLTIGDSTSSV